MLYITGVGGLDEHMGAKSNLPCMPGEGLGFPSSGVSTGCWISGPKKQLEEIRQSEIHLAVAVPWPVSQG